MNDALLMERARETAKRALGGKYDLLLACRELSSLRGRLPVIADDLFDIFDGVASEVDGLPIGPERAHWNAEALRLKEVEVAEYRARVNSTVLEALQRLIGAIDKASERRD